MMKQEIEQLAGDRLELIQKASFIIGNELLFCIFYYLSEWNRPITIQKLAKDLGSDEVFLADHLQILVSFGFVGSDKGKFRVTLFGKEAIRFIEEGVGRRPYQAAAAMPSEVYSEIMLFPGASTAGADTTEIPLSMSFQKFEVKGARPFRTMPESPTSDYVETVNFDRLIRDVAKPEDETASLHNLR